ncbi:MAG: tetratricopeptide repeat protein [Nitrospirota bacterium]|nr:MAG: tetratricopeptide repeat protein [Nitrospirota bacterium]
MADKSTVLKQTQKLIAKGQIDKAIGMWVEFVGSNPDANIYNTIGDLYLKVRDKNNAKTWYQKSGKYLHDEGFYKKAIAIYRKALNCDPADPYTLLALGDLNKAQGMDPEAIKFFLAAVDALKKKGKNDEVLAVYNKILEIAPSNLPLRLKIAEYYIKEGLNTNASKELIHAARMFEEKGDSGKSLEHFDKAIKLDPQNKEAYLSMSKMYDTRGKGDEALKILNKAIAAFPDDTDLQVQVVEQLVGNQQFDQATSILKNLAKKDPENIGIKEQIAHIHSLKGNKEKAWDIYEEIIDELHLMKKPQQLIEILQDHYDQDPVDIGKRLAYLYKDNDDKESAVQEFIKVGSLLADSGMQEEALSIYNEAKSLDPENVNVQQAIADLSQEVGFEEASEVAEKSTEEALTDVEIFLRYGQTEEAGKVLESLKSKEPENIEVHKKLKSLYIETGEKEMAVTECLVLANLYGKTGNTEMKEQVMNEAFDIDPQDPRLVDRAPAPSAPVIEEQEPAVMPEDMGVEASTLTPSGLEEVSAGESFEEEMSEADFYFRQGLNSEALKIYEKLAASHPGNEEIQEKIRIISSMSESVPLEEASFGIEPDIEEEVETSLEEEMVTDSSFGEGLLETSLEEEIIEESPIDSFADLSADLSLESTESLDLEAEAPEPTLENDVLEIFEEFKKGIETELDEGDSETHYNLGIAYKEMGLLDDAIKEFQTANKDPERSIQASSMLGLCYIEKGIYSSAIEALHNVLSKITDKDDAYWGTKFDLADAYEKNGNIQEAVDIFSEVYSNDSKFRKVDERLNKLGGTARKEKTVQDKKKKKDRISYI